MEVHLHMVVVLEVAMATLLDLLDLPPGGKQSLVYDEAIASGHRFLCGFLLGNRSDQFLEASVYLKSRLCHD